MRRVLFVSTMEGSPWGGSEELWSQAAVRLATETCQVAASVPHCTQERPALSLLEKAGVAVYSRSASASPWERAWGKVTGRRRAGLLNRADASWLRRQNAGLVCISQGGITDGLPWMLHCRRFGIPYVVIVQSNAEWLWPDDRQAEELALAYGSARLCCFVSQTNRALLEDQIGQKLPNSVMVRNPCNVQREAQPEWPSTEPDWRVACVARLDPVAKGQDLLLHLLAQEKWRRRNLKVGFYGSGRCEKNMRSLAIRLGLAGAAAFRGQVGDVEQIWAENHALVLPSRYEGTPLSLVEAMLCARPSIVTDVAGNSELVEHGVSGFVASAPTVTGMDRALEEAWERRDDWRAIGAIARERIRVLMPPDPVGVFSDRLTDIYKH